MSKLNITPTAIEDKLTFKLHGNTYTRLNYNPSHDLYLYSVTHEDTQIAWEVVRPVGKHRTYPSDEQFGTYGRCISYSESLRPRMLQLFHEGWSNNIDD